MMSYGITTTQWVKCNPFVWGCSSTKTMFATTLYGNQIQLEQLECLHSEIPPRRPMITHTSDSHQIPSQRRHSQSYKFKKIAKKPNLDILRETLYATHHLKLLDKKYKYEKDETRTVDATERTRDAGRTDGRTDGVKPISPPTISSGGYN